MAKIGFKGSGFGQMSSLPNSFAQMVNDTANVESQGLQNLSASITDAIKQRIDEKKFNAKMGSLAKSGLKAIKNYNANALPDFEDASDIDDMSNTDAMSAWEGFNQAMTVKQTMLKNQQMQNEIEQGDFQPSVNYVELEDGTRVPYFMQSKGSAYLMDRLMPGNTAANKPTVHMFEDEDGNMHSAYFSDGKYSGMKAVKPQLSLADADLDDDGELDEEEIAPFMAAYGDSVKGDPVIMGAMRRNLTPGMKLPKNKRSKKSAAAPPAPAKNPYDAFLDWAKKQNKTKKQ
jgi:hypothetical protein